MVTERHIDKSKEARENKTAIRSFDDDIVQRRRTLGKALNAPAGLHRLSQIKVG